MSAAHRDRNSWRVALTLAATLLHPALAGAQDSPCAVAVLDHVPIAVTSLGRAQLTYEQLGFRLKPGRVHANGLRNVFVKLAEGGYLELISPERGVMDAQSERYVNQLAAGEGGGALALQVDLLQPLLPRLLRDGVAVDVRTYGRAFSTLAFTDAELHWLFLIEYLTPVVDAPELLSHPNTAVALETVWLQESTLATLPAIGPVLCLPAVRAAADVTGSAPVVGVTIRVRSAHRAQQVLRAAGLDAPFLTDERGRRVVVPPDRAHGIFIEFLEAGSRSGW